MAFEERLHKRIQEIGSNLCVGLDPRMECIAGDPGAFLKKVLRETAEYAAAFKPNIAYFEALGVSGYALLESVLQEAPDDVPVILDCKRSDIPETQRYYAKAYFENWNVDAVTLNPLLGYDSIEPFLRYAGKGVYLLGITSNKGAEEFLLKKQNDAYFFEAVQRMRLQAQGLPGTVGMVAGLTNLADEWVTRIADLPLLVPGLRAQGGTLSRLKALSGAAPVLINVSRGILYGRDGKSFAERAREHVKKISEVL